MAESWESLLEGAGRYRLESMLLPEYLPKQRLVRRQGAAHPHDQDRGLGALSRIPTPRLALVEVQYEKGEPETYFLPLGLAFGKEADRVQEMVPAAIILSPAISHDGPGFLHDAVFDDRTGAALLSLIEHGQAGAGAKRVDPG